MSELVVQPTQWTRIQDMNDIDRSLSSSDIACLADIRETLRKHDALERFGVTLLHKHFELADNECLLESMDIPTRTLVVRPVPASAVEGATQTQWKLSGRDPSQWCAGFCHYNNGHKHGHTHGIVGDEV